jgi:hypothetical protein
MWLPETAKLCVIDNSSLVDEIDTFCSLELSPTMSLINHTKKNAIVLLNKQQKCLPLSLQFSPVWNTVPSTNSLYNLLSTPSVISETFTLHYLKPQETMGYPRMHEISELVGPDGVARIMQLEAPFPGKRPHLLYEASFTRCENDPSSAVMQSSESSLTFRFESPDIVTRLLRRHGDEGKKAMIRIEKEGGVKERWLMKGIHPLVPTTDPNPRPFSSYHPRLKVERTSTEDSSNHTRMMLPDAVEVLHKASQSSSSLISSSKKADVGSVSLKVPIKADVEGKMIQEMRTNALVMNKARFQNQAAILFLRAISCMHKSIACLCEDNDLILKSRFKKDFSLEVCLLLNLIFIYSPRSPSATLSMIE